MIHLIVMTSDNQVKIRHIEGEMTSMKLRKVLVLLLKKIIRGKRIGKRIGYPKQFPMCNDNVRSVLLSFRIGH